MLGTIFIGALTTWFALQEFRHRGRLVDLLMQQQDYLSRQLLEDLEPPRRSATVFQLGVFAGKGIWSMMATSLSSSCSHRPLRYSMSSLQNVFNLSQRLLTPRCWTSEAAVESERSLVVVFNAP